MKHNKLPVFYQNLNEKELEKKDLEKKILKENNRGKLLEFYKAKYAAPSFFYKPISKMFKQL